MYPLCLSRIHYVLYNGNMSKGAINFSTKNEYYTPYELVAMFGQFDYDPATTPERAKILGIPNYDTEETDGLEADWTKYKRIWINPPFTKKAEFWEKAWHTYWKAYNDIYFLCPISWLTTKQFHKHFRGGIIYIPTERIKFETSEGISKSPAFGSVIIKLDYKESKVEVLDLEYQRFLDKIK